MWETEDELILPVLHGRADGRQSRLPHPLLTPLARAEDAVARLEARRRWPPTVVEGLRARLSYLEAAGWPGYAHGLIRWIWPCGIAA